MPARAKARRRRVAAPGTPRPRPLSAWLANPPGAAGDWRDETLSTLRRVILSVDPAIVEEVKWRKPSNPDGVPVWSLHGILCVGNVLKNAVRLTFPKGPEIPDPHHLFDPRSMSRAVRTIDVPEGGTLNERALATIVREAVRLNTVKAQSR